MQSRDGIEEGGIIHISVIECLNDDVVDNNTLEGGGL